MLWFRTFGWVEIVIIALFIAFYGLYLYRIISISRALGTPFTSVFAKLIVRTAFMALLIIAFLGPSFGDARREIKAVGKDIMICVDLSKSMDAIDIQPSRLEKIKFELKKVVDAFSSDRIGIIIFSSEAFVQCPLTFDQNALDLFIETMNTTLVPSSGTDFAPPLRMALDKLNEETGTRSTSQKSKIILLISDGEDFGEETPDIINDIEKNEIRLFTLGIGTEQGSQLPSGRGFKTDEQGRLVITKLNPSGLKKLAQQTNGQYFEINDNSSDISRLINTIGSIQGEARDARMVDVSANRYFYFLLGAVGLLILDVLLSVRTIRI